MIPLQNLAELYLLTCGSQKLEKSAPLLPEGRNVPNAVGADSVPLLLTVSIISLNVIGNKGNVVDFALHGFTDSTFVHFVYGIAVF